MKEIKVYKLKKQYIFKQLSVNRYEDFCTNILNKLSQKLN